VVLEGRLGDLEAWRLGGLEDLGSSSAGGFCLCETDVYRTGIERRRMGLWTECRDTDAEPMDRMWKDGCEACWPDAETGCGAFANYEI